MSKKVLVISTIIWIVMAIAFVLGINFDKPETCGISVIVFTLAYLVFLGSYAEFSGKSACAYKPKHAKPKYKYVDGATLSKRH